MAVLLPHLVKDILSHTNVQGLELSERQVLKTFSPPKSFVLVPMFWSEASFAL